MATSKLGQVYAKCPFYRSSDALKIVCEGITDDCTINLIFNARKKETCIVNYFAMQGINIVKFTECWRKNMQTKYRSKKAYYKTEEFDSKKERDRYVELCLLEKAGEIYNLRRQVKFLLIPAQTEHFERFSEKTGKRLQDGVRVLERECNYIADFVYQMEDGKTIVEDTKGFRTPDYIIKKKLMLYFHKIKIKEV